MHLSADAMTGEFSHHTIPFRLAVVLNRAADIAHMVAGFGHGNGLVERIMCRHHQTSDLLTYLADTERVARVAVETIQQCSTVDRDDVTIAQDGLVVRNTMHHHIID